MDITQYRFSIRRWRPRPCRRLSRLTLLRILLTVGDLTVERCSSTDHRDLNEPMVPLGFILVTPQLVADRQHYTPGGITLKEVGDLQS